MTSKTNQNIIICVGDDADHFSSVVNHLHEEHNNKFKIMPFINGTSSINYLNSIVLEKKNNIIIITYEKLQDMTSLQFFKNVNGDAGKIMVLDNGITDLSNSYIDQNIIDFYVNRNCTDGLSLFINRLDYAKKSGFFVTATRTLKEKETALRLQNQVFSEQHLALPYHQGIKKIGVNPYDEHTTVYIAVSLPDRKMMGATSLSKANKLIAKKFKTDLGLPLEEFYHLDNIKYLDENLAQVRNATVLPEFQRRLVGPRIWGEIYRENKRSNNRSKYALIHAASDISDAILAKSLFKNILNQGLYDSQLNINVRDPINSIDNVKSTTSKSVDVSSQDVINMYFTIGFKLIGKPVYNKRFKTYDFPMILDLDNVQEPYGTLFESGKI